MVLTAKYHLDNGTCCGNGCLNCPYDHIKVPEPKRSELKASLALSAENGQRKNQ
jgi:hypothetical protein